MEDELVKKQKIKKTLLFILIIFLVGGISATLAFYWNRASMFGGTGRNSPVFTLDLGPKFNIDKVTSFVNGFLNTGKSNSNFKVYVPDATVQFWVIARYPSRFSTSNVIIKNYS